MTRQFAMRNQNYGGLVNANAIKGPEKMDLRPYLNIAGTGENFLSDQDYPSLFKGLQRNWILQELKVLDFWFST